MLFSKKHLVNVRIVIAVVALFIWFMLSRPDLFVQVIDSALGVQ